MAEALSQSQIDALLNKMQNGGADDEPEEVVVEEKVQKTYDFTSPKKFTKDQLKSLTTIHETFGRNVAVYFTSILRNVCEINVLGAEEQRYYEYNNCIPELTLIGMFAVEPLNTDYLGGTLMLEFPVSFGFLLVEKLAGGSGDSTSAPDREYTDVEKELLRYIFNIIERYMQESWDANVEAKITLTSLETNGRLLQPYAYEDVVVITTMDFSDGHYDGVINICMSGDNVEALTSNVGTKYSYTQRAHNPVKELIRRETIMHYLKESDLLVFALLDQCKMAFHDVASLRPGDLIILDKRIDTDINLMIKGKPWASARMGEIDERRAVKIVNIVTNDQEENEEGGETLGSE